jgi:carbon monoxide dehydrogenase subunit G
MAHIKTSITINAPAQKAFDLLTNPNKIPLVMPGLIANTNVPELPLKPGDHFDFEYQMFGVRIHGVWTVNQIESPHTYVAQTSGGGDSTWTYTLSEENGVTLVTLEIDYVPPASVLEKIQQHVAEKMNAHEVEAYLQNLKILIELHA